MRCNYEDCNKKILSMVIDCNKCKKLYCASHRLPELHKCDYLMTIKNEAFESNKKILDSNKIVTTQL